jgi:hypothetical protein
MLITYETGEQMIVEVVGNAENINVRLDKNNLKLETSITLISQKTVRITNRSSSLVSFFDLGKI